MKSNKRYKMIGILILLIFALLSLNAFISPHNFSLLTNIEAAFEDDANSVLISRIVPSDWQRVCVDTGHMPMDIIGGEMRGVSNYDTPFLRSASIFYAGSVYFIRDNQIVDSYVFSTGGRSLDFAPLAVKIRGERYFLFAEGFIDSAACLDRDKAKFKKYTDTSFGEKYNKLIFTSK